MLRMWCWVGERVYWYRKFVELVVMRQIDVELFAQRREQRDEQPWRAQGRWSRYDLCMYGLVV